MHKVSFLRRFAALTLALLLLCSVALAAPRYPEKTGDVTDAALLLSADVLADWAKLRKNIERATDVELYIATVDFLDGATLDDYGAGLRKKWDLGDDDLLLLMAAGEDAFALFGGEDVNRRFPAAAQQKLLSTNFQAAFLAQDYDGALTALAPALARELGKAFNESISVDGLFGQVAKRSEPSIPDWLSRPVATVTETPRTETLRDRVTQEDQSSGISLGKLILTFFFLSIIFGNSKRRRRRGCMGCGCAPFSSILAALGLWKVWDKD